MKKVLVIKKDNLEDIKLINKYDKYDNVITSIDEETKKAVMSEEEYKELQRKSNEIEHELVIEHENKTKEVCYISGLKDIKQATLTFSDLKNISKKIVSEGADYALNTLGMETIFINTEKDNQKLTKLLNDLNFINIGEVDGKTTYLKEKEDKEIGSMQSEHRKRI